MFQERSFRITFMISVLLHLLILLTYRPMSGFLGWLPRSVSAEPESRISDPIVFEFQKELVETPEEAEVDEPQIDAPFLSDKNARAQDMYAAADLNAGLTFSDGISQYKIFEGGGTDAEAQQMPQDGSEGSQDREDLAQKNADQLPWDETAIFDQQRNQMQQRRFSPELLRGTGNRTNPSFSDDASWNNLESSAEDLGGVSLNTYAWEYGPYILYMKRRLRNHIYPPPAFYQMGVISAEVKIRFRVHLDGETTDIELLSYEGHKSLVETSLNAIRASAPFRPLPSQFPEKFLELTWTFIYSIQHR
jgi:hypothetical protein